MRRDERHDEAVRTWQRLRDARRPLATTNLVLTESHALIVRSGGMQSGLAFLDGVLTPTGPEVAWVDEDIARSAIDRWIRPYQDKTWSWTDAVSFELMHRNGMREAFAFDAHFEQAGFVLV